MVKSLSRFLLSIVMTIAGTTHLVQPAPFVKIVPAFLPFPLQLVYISGFFEILGGLGLLVPFFRRAAAYGLIALFISVFPANINMAVNNLPFGTIHSPVLVWLRLPLQVVLILWAWWVR